MRVDDISDNGIEKSIAKKLKALIVERAAFFIALSATSVGKCNLVVSYVVGIEANNALYRQSKILVIAERESYLFNYVF